MLQRGRVARARPRRRGKDEHEPQYIRDVIWIALLGALFYVGSWCMVGAPFRPVGLVGGALVAVVACHVIAMAGFWAGRS